MSKALLLSIKPKYCELIALGKKTVEVRKTRPKMIDVPFKGYIYCTKARELFSYGGGLLGASDQLYRLPTGEIKFGDSIELMCCNDEYSKDNFLNGKVIGEFVCDRTEEIRVVDTELMRYVTVNDKADMFISEETRLSVDELYDYLWPKKGYGFHISDLVIYDKPRELSEFYRECEKPECEDCPNLFVENTPDYYEVFCCYDEKIPLTRPPQSWGYVEELS